MAEAITIPSPSVFLTTSPQKPASPPTNKVDRPRARHIRKPSQSKRVATAAKAGAPISELTGKPKQSKSRNGCSTCKAKRLKCDEGKPGCQQCSKRNVDCGGYKKDFKWRPFEETVIKTSAEKRQKASSPKQPAASSLQAASSTSAQRPSPTRTDSARHTGSSSTSPAQALNRASPQQSLPLLDDHDGVAGIALSIVSPLPTGVDPLSTPVGSVASQTYFDSNFSSSYDEVSTDLLSPFDYTNTADYTTFDPAQLFRSNTPNQTLDPSLPDLIPDTDVEEVVRETDLSTDLSLTRDWTDLDIQFWDLPPIPLEPVLTEDSAEMLCMRFDKLTCGILSVMDGPNENPWRSLIWPLAHSSPALYHAITAMTAFHSSKDVPVLRITGHEHKQASIQYIQEGIRDNSMSLHTAIATALALGFSESWDQHTASGNTHIKGAQALVKRALKEHKKNPLEGVDLLRLKFLCNAWVYMDVIARLTSVDSDESNDFDNLYLFSTSQDAAARQSSHGFGIDFGMPVDARLDPLMGCAGTLFPIIGRVANLVRKVCRSQSNSPAVISQADDLRGMLEAWQPPAFIEDPDDPSTSIMHSIQTAEAYRWSTLLHLHQSVPELPSPSSADLARKTLSYLATVPLSSRTVIVHIYPLMVAGCEAWTLEDRAWVRDRWTAMGSRMRIGVIDKCATVTEEVWQRKNAYEAQPSGTQRKLVATAELQDRSGAASSSRVKRPHPEGATLAEPGRSGMVFSWLEEDEEQPSREKKASKWPERQSPKHVIGSMDPAYTVRGHLHWVGVMWDWGWEVLLG